MKVLPKLSQTMNQLLETAAEAKAWEGYRGNKRKYTQLVPQYKEELAKLCKAGIDIAETGTGPFLFSPAGLLNNLADLGFPIPKLGENFSPILKFFLSKKIKSVTRFINSLAEQANKLELKQDGFSFKTKDAWSIGFAKQTSEDKRIYKMGKEGAGKVRVEIDLKTKQVKTTLSDDGSTLEYQADHQGLDTGKITALHLKEPGSFKLEEQWDRLDHKPSGE